MYKTLSFHYFFFRFFFPVVSIVGFGSFIYMDIFNGNFLTSDFSKGFTVALLWSFILLFNMVRSVRMIETTESVIKIRSWKKIDEIPYKNIEWIALVDFANVFGVTIKYYNDLTRISKKISYFPRQEGFNTGSKDLMFKFIKDKIAQENPDYSAVNQPTYIKNFIKLFIIGLPFFILTFYYLLRSFGMFID